MLVKRLLWSLPESDEIRENLDPAIYEVLQGCLQPRAADRLQGNFTTDDLVTRAREWAALTLTIRFPLGPDRKDHTIAQLRKLPCFGQIAA